MSRNVHIKLKDGQKASSLNLGCFGEEGAKTQELFKGLLRQAAILGVSQINYLGDIAYSYLEKVEKLSDTMPIYAATQQVLSSSGLTDDQTAYLRSVFHIVGMGNHEREAFQEFHGILHSAKKFEKAEEQLRKVLGAVRSLNPEAAELYSDKVLGEESSDGIHPRVKTNRFFAVFTLDHTNACQDFTLHFDSSNPFDLDQLIFLYEAFAILSDTLPIDYATGGVPDKRGIAVTVPTKETTYFTADEIRYLREAKVRYLKCHHSLMAEGKRAIGHDELSKYDILGAIENLKNQLGSHVFCGNKEGLIAFLRSVGDSDYSGCGMHEILFRVCNMIPEFTGLAPSFIGVHAHEHTAFFALPNMRGMPGAEITIGSSVTGKKLACKSLPVGDMGNLEDSDFVLTELDEAKSEEAKAGEEQINHNINIRFYRASGEVKGEFRVNWDGSKFVMLPGTDYLALMINSLKPKYFQNYKEFYAGLINLMRVMQHPGVIALYLCLHLNISEVIKDNESKLTPIGKALNNLEAESGLHVNARLDRIVANLEELYRAFLSSYPKKLPKEFACVSGALHILKAVQLCEGDFNSICNSIQSILEKNPGYEDPRTLDDDQPAEGAVPGAGAAAGGSPHAAAGAGVSGPAGAPKLQVIVEVPVETAGAKAAAETKAASDSPVTPVEPVTSLDYRSGVRPQDHDAGAVHSLMKRRLAYYKQSTPDFLVKLLRLNDPVILRAMLLNYLVVHARESNQSDALLKMFAVSSTTDLVLQRYIRDYLTITPKTRLKGWEAYASLEGVLSDENLKALPDYFKLAMLNTFMGDISAAARAQVKASYVAAYYSWRHYVPVVRKPELVTAEGGSVAKTLDDAFFNPASTCRYAKSDAADPWARELDAFRNLQARQTSTNSL